MIEKVTMYGAVCDACGNWFTSGTGSFSWTTFAAAKENALKHGWLEAVQPNKIICYDCVEESKRYMEMYKDGL